MSQIRVTQHQLDAFAFFVAANPQFIEKGAAALVGNFCQESGEDIDPTMFRAKPDASGGRPQDDKSGGIAEWLNERQGVGRKANCIAFSRKEEIRRGLAAGSLLNDRLTQCAFVIHELLHGDDGNSPGQYADLYHQLTVDTGRSIGTLTANFMLAYERPSKRLNDRGERIDGLDNRISHAQAVFDRAQVIKAAAKPQQARPEPITQAPVIQVPELPTQPPRTAPADLPAWLSPVTAPAGPLISAHIAGRQMAILDNLHDLRASVVAEKEAYLVSTAMTLATIDKTISDFEDLSPVPTTKAIAAPLALPKPISPQPSVTTSIHKGKSMEQMNPQVLSALRSTLIFVGGIAASKGWVDNATMMTIVGSITAVAPAAWSLWSHRQAGVIAAAAASPVVQQIMTTPEIANSPTFIANPTVVSGSREMK